MRQQPFPMQGQAEADGKNIGLVRTIFQSLDGMTGSPVRYRTEKGTGVPVPFSVHGSRRKKPAKADGRLRNV